MTPSKRTALLNFPDPWSLVTPVCATGIALWSLQHVILALKKEFIRPGLHLRPVCADHARLPLQWTALHHLHCPTEWVCFPESMTITASPGGTCSPQLFLSSKDFPFHTYVLHLKIFFIGVYLLYNVVLAFTVQQSKSALCIHILSSLLGISFPFRWSQSAE